MVKQTFIIISIFLSFWSVYAMEETAVDTQQVAAPQQATIAQSFFPWNHDVMPLICQHASHETLFATLEALFNRYMLVCKQWYKIYHRTNVLQTLLGPTAVELRPKQAQTLKKYMASALFSKSASDKQLARNLYHDLKAHAQGQPTSLLQSLNDTLAQTERNSFDALKLAIILNPKEFRHFMDTAHYFHMAYPYNEEMRKLLIHLRCNAIRYFQAKGARLNSIMKGPLAYYCLNTSPDINLSKVDIPLKNAFDSRKSVDPKEILALAQTEKEKRFLIACFAQNSDYIKTNAAGCSTAA